MFVTQAPADQVAFSNDRQDLFEASVKITYSKRKPKCTFEYHRDRWLASVHCTDDDRIEEVVALPVNHATEPTHL